MIDPIFLKDKISSILPQTLGADIRDSIESAIQLHFEQMNLVSRQEFDIQQKVLAKTRAKLEALEKLLEEIQAQK